MDSRTLQVLMLALHVSGVVLFAQVAAAERVCVVAEVNEAQVRQSVAGTRHVAVARVAGESPDQDGRGSTFTLSTVRAYKGPRLAFRAHRRYCEDCGSLRVADYVLVFAAAQDFEFDSCSEPGSLYQKHIRNTVAILDRQMGYPPLEVPKEVLSGKW